MNARRIFPVVVGLAIGSLAAVHRPMLASGADATPTSASSSSEQSQSDPLFKPRPPSALRAAVSDALRAAAATKKPTERDRAVRQLMLILLELEQDQNLPHDERVSLHGQVRSRLSRIQKTLSSELARPGQPVGGPAKSEQRTAAQEIGAPAQNLADPNIQQNPAILAQMIMPGAFGAAAPPRGAIGAPVAGVGAAPQQFDYGPDLVALIQAVISPRTWDVNGGPGSIVYFRNFRVLVVRAPAEVQSTVGDVLGQLRK